MLRLFMLDMMNAGLGSNPPVAGLGQENPDCGRARKTVVLTNQSDDQLF